jgi:hypothetical protein
MSSSQSATKRVCVFPAGILYFRMKVKSFVMKLVAFVLHVRLCSLTDHLYNQANSFMFLVEFYRNYIENQFRGEFDIWQKIMTGILPSNTSFYNMFS